MLVTAALAAVMLTTAAATAQDDRGRLHFQAGASYYEAGEYENALREFTRAYELSQRPALFYNIAGCYQQLGDYANAVTYLERYLNEVSDIANRGNLETRLAHLRERATATTTATTPDATSTTTDTTTTDTTTDPQVVPEAVDPEGGGEADVSGGEGSGLRIGGFVGLGIGGAGVILATAFGVMALKERNSVADGCGMDRSCMPGDVDRMDKLALASDVGLAIGVAGLATGIVLLIVGGSDDDEGETPPEGLSSVRVSPWMGPAGAGASLTGRF
jgi:hypothetical protein